MDTGVMIAVLIIGLYICAGPFILLGLYILFDRLAERDPVTTPVKDLLDRDPSLWSPADVDEYLTRKVKMASMEKKAANSLGSLR
jgi:hypothetical protein